MTARDKQVFVSRTHDNIVMINVETMKLAFSWVKYSIELTKEKDGSYTGTLCELDLVENADSKNGCIETLVNAIKEYAILELKLSDVTNAYDEFEDAKNRDAELAYGDSMIEMLKAISDGFLSGKVGSEEFKAACKALVPDSVIANCTTFEERLDAIDDYFENSKCKKE